MMDGILDEFELRADSNLQKLSHGQKKKFLIAFLFIALILVQSMGNFQNWENHDYMRIFAFLFLTWGFIIAGYSYPGFRNKEKSMAYLMLPASASEKFVME